MGLPGAHLGQPQPVATVRSDTSSQGRAFRAMGPACAPASCFPHLAE